MNIMINCIDRIFNYWPRIPQPEPKSNAVFAGEVNHEKCGITFTLNSAR